MRVLVIGGTGRIGSYLVPRLLQAGYEVACISRGKSGPYHRKAAWREVQRIEADRAADDPHTFIRHVADAAPDVVIDLLCYDRPDAEPMIEALRGRIQHLIVCGTISVFGPSHELPTTETGLRQPRGEYGRKKLELETYLLHAARRTGFPVTVLHPGHVVGRGWVPVNPQGNFNTSVFEQLASGGTVSLPDQGMATLHHVHADDVAHGFLQAIERWNAAIGESFLITSPGAVTVRHYAETVARLFGKEASLSYLPWTQWLQTLTEVDADISRDHLERSPCFSIEKARRVLGYEPRYHSLEAVRNSLEWLVAAHRVDAPPLG